ncbi:MAG: hypothetical protein ACYTGV_19635, partial [Planctomycetota bacterium]
ATGGVSDNAFKVEPDDSIMEIIPLCQGSCRLTSANRCVCLSGVRGQRPRSAGEPREACPKAG